MVKVTPHGQSCLTARYFISYIGVFTQLFAKDYPYNNSHGILHTVTYM